MDILSKIESLLYVYEDTEWQRDNLENLINKLPKNVEFIKIENRKRAQAIGSQALYQLGRLQDVILWSTPIIDSQAYLWQAYAYFDLKNFSESLICIEKAMSLLDLQDWCYWKLYELKLCCVLYIDSDNIKNGDFDILRKEYEKLGDFCPIAIELLAALNWYKSSPFFKAHLYDYIWNLFINHFIEHKLINY
ncbi:hypothetical protein KKF34_06200 [Myxococcota bacterium]|nr:hypothetical protein [Myxococcota bacterium]MBU1379193.1 hypothetical protein [Myxococcota bacterium]MBU1496450.1 hypothetical protein [Myxococcota bacterium]